MYIRTVIIRGNERGEKRQINGKGSGRHGPAAGDFLGEVGGRGLRESCELCMCEITFLISLIRSFHPFANPCTT